MMSEGPLVTMTPRYLDLIYRVISESAQKSLQPAITHTLMPEGHFFSQSHPSLPELILCPTTVTHSRAIVIKMFYGSEIDYEH